MRYLKHPLLCGTCQCLVWLLALVVISLSTIAPNARAAAGTITEFPIPTAHSTAHWHCPRRCDRNLWFTEATGNKIGRITPGGTLTEFRVPTANSTPIGIAPGADRNLWFTEGTGNKIGRITPGGTLTEFPIPTAHSTPIGIVSGGKKREE
jgi:streptogramin lyase